MKKPGCATAVVGAVLLLSGIALFIVTGIRSMKARPVASIPLAVGRTVRSDLISVDASQPCSISITANVRSKRSSFSFPLRYSVFDPSGAVLSSLQTVFGDRTQAVYTDRTMIGAIGLYRHEFGYGQFAVKPPGRIRVEAQIDPDTRVSPEAVDNITLIVYEHAIDQKTPVIAATVLALGGVVIGVVGFFMLVAAAPRPGGQ